MFYAMAQNKIDTRGHLFEHILQDIETLNQRALRGELHVSAVSIHAYAYLTDKYSLLPCGASMGDGYGPMLVVLQEAPSGADAVREWLHSKTIAIPGVKTSAYLALRLFAGEVKTVTIPFDEIFDAVKAGSTRRSTIGLDSMSTSESVINCSFLSGPFPSTRAAAMRDIGSALRAS